MSKEVMLNEVTEKEFQQQVNDLLRHHGYYVYHPHRSERSSKGWPDVVALGPAGEEPARLLVLELKSMTGKATPAQDAWLNRWRKVERATVAVVRPDDWEWLVEIARQR